MKIFASFGRLATAVMVVASCSSDPAPSTGNQPETCTNGTLDPNEVAVDCGGACTTRCNVAQTCRSGSDCATGSCGVAQVDIPMDDPAGGSAQTTGAATVDCATTACTCLAASGTDRVKNGDETDVDCGGSAAPKCGYLLACTQDTDCRSNKCTGGMCAPSSNDGTRNGMETDVDCGGDLTTKCAAGRRCLVAFDCESNSCVGKICQKATYNDGAKNLDETDVDCGGPGEIARCGEGLGCQNRSDCQTKACNSVTKVCIRPAINGTQDGDETDVDCGGPAAPGCVVGKKCGVGSDCESLVCTANFCAAPTSTDGVKNGDETDVDCGGTTTGAPKCANGKACRASGDCASDGCDYKKTCVAFRSCTAHFGGDTCGPGEIGEPGAAHESCCTTIPVKRPTGALVQLGKYTITAGRFRTFLERTAGNVRDAVAAKWPAPYAAYLSYLPTNITEANAQVGPIALDWEWPPPGDPTYPRNPWAARGCQNQFGGARTYYQVTGADQNYYPQDVLDQKMMNCVTKIMALAFCIWDGGTLPGKDDMQYAWRGPNGFTYPWGNSPAPPTTDFNNSTLLVHRYNYQYPAYVAPDSSYLVGAPGRRPAGNGPLGHSDMAGGLYQFEYDALFQANGSWERHVPAANGVPSGTQTQMWNRRYYAMGARCVY